jgi:hypothetical protein
MKPRHLLLLGGTGFGKTSLARMLAAGAPRVLVFDHEEDVTWQGLGSTFRDPQLALQLLMDHPRDDWQAVLRMPTVAHDLVMLEALMEVTTERRLPPILVVMEEATLFSGAQSGMPDQVEAVVTRGRKRGLVLLHIAQETTQLATSVRRQSYLTVTMGQGEPFPAEVRRMFGEGPLELEPLDPWTVPEYGRHYLTAPADQDPFTHLRAAIQADPPRPLGADYRPPRSL